MQLFQSIQRSLAMMGIGWNQHRSNLKIFMTFVLYWSLVALYCSFLLLEADEFREYMDTVYLISSTTMIALCFMNFVWKMAIIFKMIHEIEEIVENSEYFIGFEVKYQTISNIFLGLTKQTVAMTYDETNRQVEKWSEIIYHVMAQATPMAWVLPKFVGCIFIYFTTESELKHDALELPLPMWSVG